ncbi:MAG: NAD(P)H-dependent oxidoreductase [Thermoleophilia bacterium]|nr:NAD(P)H-dependent oxidoreductase [Thermoleophilia bacterium]
MINLHVVIASVRPGRVGLPVGKWFESVAREDDRFEVRLVDLFEVGLPFMDEPEQPHLRQYSKEHTKAWSATIEPADAFVFVTPEYNASPAPSLLNAIDTLHHEWKYKPVGFVPYGGISGGQRAAQALKPTLLQLSMMPVPAQVPLPFVSQSITEDGRFEATDRQVKAAASMLNELARWAEALRPMREAG